MPPAAKHPDARRRRNLAPDTIKLPAGGPRKDDKPDGKPLTPPPIGPGFQKEITAWWKLIWSSPMAVMWEAADVPALRRLARLHNRIATGDAIGVDFTEISKLEDKFGLNPKARKHLQWEIVPDDVYYGTDAADQAEPEAGKRGKRRSGRLDASDLQVLDGGK